MSRLACEELRQLIVGVSSEKIEFKDLLSVMSRYLPDVARHSHIGLIKASLSSLDFFGNDPESGKEIVFYSDESVDYNSMKAIHYTIGNGANATIFGALCKGYEWDEDLIADFDTLATILYVLYGRCRMKDYLNHMARTDMLTGVANAPALHRFMGMLYENNQYRLYYVNFLNVKNMKVLNERYNEKMGDQLLVQYAKKIESYIGQTGMIARMGGDNFVCVIEKTRQQDFMRFLEELCVELIFPDESFDFVKMDSRVGYCNLNPGNNPREAIKYASTALNVAKRSRGADYVEFEERMIEQVIRTRELEESIPDALGNGEFIVYYQPKVWIKDDDTRVLHGAEALVRWNRKGTMVSPGEFIPLLENNGLVTDVDMYVFEHVCMDIKKWENEGITPVCISSNFSRRHLLDKYFAEKIAETIMLYDVDPKYIEIEITESCDEDDIDAMTNLEQQMHELGVRLSVDDFGSGFSSFKTIKDISADTIKLDKSLVDGIGNKDDEIMVQYIVQMINALGKTVIAEGVEKVEQAQFLKQCGCELIQGFLYGKPMPRLLFEEKLRDPMLV